MSSACQECGFDLYIPVAELSVSQLGIYSDSRFPGRCILSLNHHYDDMADVPAIVMDAFMSDVRDSMKAIKEITGSSRVNFAVLGNRESHVHAHLIPRYPKNEEFPDCSPWNDKRQKEELPGHEIEAMRSRFAVIL